MLERVVVVGTPADEGEWTGEYETEFIPTCMRFTQVSVSTRTQLDYPIALFARCGGISTLVCMLDGSQGMNYPDLSITLTDEFKPGNKYLLAFTLQRYEDTHGWVKYPWAARVGVVIDFTQART